MFHPKFGKRRIRSHPARQINLTIKEKQREKGGGGGEEEAPICVNHKMHDHGVAVMLIEINPDRSYWR